jgi:hypothetical protein
LRTPFVSSRKIPPRLWARSPVLRGPSLSSLAWTIVPWATWPVAALASALLGSLLPPLVFRVKILARRLLCPGRKKKRIEIQFSL